MPGPGLTCCLLIGGKEAKAGRVTLTFPEYICERLLNPPSSTLVNFGHGLGIYARVFGPGAISIVSYDQVVAEGLDLVRHFAATFLGLPELPPLDLPRVNVSPGAVDVEIIRALNAIEWNRRNGSAPVRYAITLSDRLLARRDSRSGSCLVRAMQNYIGKLAINEASDGLQRLHAELFTTFKSALVEPRLARLFFEPRRVEVPLHSP